MAEGDELNRRELARALDGGVLDALRGYGFKSNRAQELVWRPFPGGMHQVSVGVVVRRDWFDASLVAAIRLDAVEEIINQFTVTSEAGRKWTPTSLTRLEYFTGGRTSAWVIRDPADVEHVITQMGGILIDAVLPFMEAHSSVEAFDRAMNREPTGFDITTPLGHSMAALTVARLAGNPDYEKLRAAHRASFGPQFDPGLRDQFDRLVEYLDQLQP